MTSSRVGSLALVTLLAGACFNPDGGDDDGNPFVTSGPVVTATQGEDESTGAPTEAGCGNGAVEEGEDCDDGGESATCNADCTTAACGDGVLNPTAGEICDDGNTDPDDGCNAMCMPLECGDGIVAAPETCDDGNRDQTDDCVGCQAAACGDGYVQAGVEECDDGNGDDTDACPGSCQTASCGDGYVLAGAEECDDGNAVDTDDCLTGCVAASCGDGYVQMGVEGCDDGNLIDTDACLSTCTMAACGDGVVQDGVEQCDDANGIPDDGCDNCTLTCGTDCWSDAGCLTDAGRCIRFTCTSGMDSATACGTCFGWQPITYDQWLNGGYCSDIIARYRTDQGTNTMCGGAPTCCPDPAGCGGGDNAWHFSNGVNNYYVGPCLGCAGDTNCTFWNNVYDADYTRITACERM